MSTILFVIVILLLIIFISLNVWANRLVKYTVNNELSSAVQIKIHKRLHRIHYWVKLIPYVTLTLAILNFAFGRWL